jgi:outer membrane biosynthesis protein TonB
MRDMIDDDEVDHAPKPPRWPYWLGAGVALVGLGFFFMLPHNATKHAHFDFITQINLPPPPPPPKPPPPPPPKPQPQQQQQKVVQNQVPKPSTNHAPPHEALTAREGPGSNPYGLTPGNGEGDTIGGGDGDGQDWSSYNPVISAALQAAISGDDALRSGQWAGEVRFWFNASGVVTRAEMVESTGDAKRDREIENRVLGRTIEANLPPDMPQPVTVAITSSST